MVKQPMFRDLTMWQHKCASSKSTKWTSMDFLSKTMRCLVASVVNGVGGAGGCEYCLEEKSRGLWQKSVGTEDVKEDVTVMADPKLV